MRVICIIILITFHKALKILHIAHIIIAPKTFYNTHAYNMIPWSHGHEIKTFQNDGSTYGTSNRESSLENT